jgi:hypothetical protein
METKTLLTIVALLLAGFATIMLARGDDRKTEDVFHNTWAGTAQESTVFNEPTAANGDRQQLGYSNSRL